MLLIRMASPIQQIMHRATCCQTLRLLRIELNQFEGVFIFHTVKVAGRCFHLLQLQSKRVHAYAQELAFQYFFSMTLNDMAWPSIGYMPAFTAA